MDITALTAQIVFSEIGSVRWQESRDAFEVRTIRGAHLFLSPNSDESIPTNVHVDEIWVPEADRRRGVATDALEALCLLADKYRFVLEGGPVGWTANPFSPRFVSWLFRFGFERHTSPDLPRADDANAFYVRRVPGNWQPRE